MWSNPLSNGVTNTYTHKCRIGNWSEEQELQETQMKEYLHRKEHGQLLVHSVQQHLNQSLHEVDLSYSQDGNVHFGDSVMMYSVKTEGVLSVDVSEKLASTETAYAVTTSTLTQAHVARNVFVIEPQESNVQVGDVLKYGQPFRLRVHPSLKEEPFYLHSQPMSHLASSKMTRKQLVSMQASRSYDTVWNVQHKDLNTRFEAEGEPVPANAELICLHAQTRQALNSDKHVYHNDFGPEFEVCGYTSLNVGKKQNLYAEKQGKLTSDTPVRQEDSCNHFAFLTATAPPEAPPAPEEQKQQ